MTSKNNTTTEAGFGERTEEEIEAMRKEAEEVLRELEVLFADDESESQSSKKKHTP